MSEITLINKKSGELVGSPLNIYGIRDKTQGKKGIDKKEKIVYNKDTEGHR